MKQWQQKVFGIVLFIAAIFLILANFEESSYAFSFLFELIQPVIVAGVLAFFLHIPMNGFRNFLQKHAKRPHKERFWNTISLVLTLLSVCIVLAAVCMLMIPALIQSIMDIYNKVQHNLPIWLNQLAAYGIDTAMLEVWLKNGEQGQLLQKLIVGVGNWVPTIFSAAASTASVVVDGVVGFILAIYLLMERHTIGRQLNKVLEANLQHTTCQKIRDTGNLICQIFRSFLCGQCLEAVILGTLMFIAFAICGISYAGLIGVLTAVCLFIPFVGAFLACCTGALLNLMIDPWKALLCILVYLVVQFIEGHFIYPKVVGNSVGLSSFWVLVAVLVGQNLFGVFGMILFIPLTSVIYTLLKNDTNRKLKKKAELAQETVGTDSEPHQTE